MSILLLLVHVLAAIVAVGANPTYAIWFRAAGTDQDRLIFVIRTVRMIDSRVANPAYVVLLITGILMVLGGAFSFTTGWIWPPSACTSRRRSSASRRSRRPSAASSPRPNGT